MQPYWKVFQFHFILLFLNNSGQDIYRLKHLSNLSLLWLNNNKQYFSTDTYHLLVVFPTASLLPFHSLIHFIHCISHLLTLMWPELNQMPLNNYYSAVIHLHPYQLAARGLGSKFLPPPGNGLYCSYMGDFHSLHLMGHPPQTFARGIAIHVFLVPLMKTMRNKEYSYFCSKQKGINQWHICACILNFKIYLWGFKLTQSY